MTEKLKDATREHIFCVDKQMSFWGVPHSDVVLESRVLVSRRLKDKNESLGLEHFVLVTISVWKKKSCSFSRHLL